ncbi:MAG: ABC transporter substrate-binding protein [Desulfobacula sp.]|nr:ABC transporter substrate-binding protein [Desulfobacula sp.]
MTFWMKCGIKTVLVAVILTVILMPGFNRDVQAKQLTPVKYEEVIRSVFYLPSYVALSKGYFKDEGLDVSIRTSWGSDKGIAALLSGNADIVLVGPETAVYIQNGESPEKVRIFCGLTATDGSMLISRNKIESFDWQNLKGKTIMSWRKGSSPALFLEHILRAKGFNLKTDVTIINNIAAPARHGAFVAGNADFATFFEPDVSKMAFSKTGYFVTSIGRQVGNIDYTVFMATQSFINKKPEVVQAWTNAIAKAQKYSLEANAAVIAKEVAQFFPKINEEFIAQSIDRYRQLSILKASPLVEPAAIKALQDLLVEGGLLKPDQRVKYEDIVVTQFAKKAMGQN